MSYQNTTKFDFKYFIELSPVLICIAGYDGYFKKVNKAVQKTLGYTEEELYAKPIDYFVYPKDREVTRKTRKDVHNDIPLLNFENRYVTKEGKIVWLLWTSVRAVDEKLVFGIANDITVKKKLDELNRIAASLNSRQKGNGELYKQVKEFSELDLEPENTDLSFADQAWLLKLEEVVRHYIKTSVISLSVLADEMAFSERQLIRRVKAVTGLTPNKFIRVVRMQIAKEAIETGKYRTISEISSVAGFETPAYFNKLFKEIYNRSVSDLL